MSDPLAELVTKIEASAQLNFPEHAEVLNKSRMRAVDVLCDIVDALQALAAPNAELLLAELATALAQLEGGVVEPILAPKKLNHRAPDPHSLWRRRMRLALGVEILCGSGLSIADACRILARPVSPEIAALRTGKMGRSDSDTLSNWVQNLRLGATAVPCLVADTYAKARPTFAEKAKGLSANDASREALKWLKSENLLSPPA